MYLKKKRRPIMIMVKDETRKIVFYKENPYWANFFS